MGKENGRKRSGFPMNKENERIYERIPSIGFGVFFVTKKATHSLYSLTHNSLSTLFCFSQTMTSSIPSGRDAVARIRQLLNESFPESLEEVNVSQVKLIFKSTLLEGKIQMIHAIEFVFIGSYAKPNRSRYYHPK